MPDETLIKVNAELVDNSLKVFIQAPMIEKFWQSIGGVAKTVSDPYNDRDTSVKVYQGEKITKLNPYLGVNLIEGVGYWSRYPTDYGSSLLLVEGLSDGVTIILPLTNDTLWTEERIRSFIQVLKQTAVKIYANFINPLKIECEVIVVETAQISE